LASDDKLTTLAVGPGVVLDRDLERFRESCLGVIIHVASGDANKLFTEEDVEMNGFERNMRRTHPDFVQTFWSDMVDEKLDIEINDHSYVCRRLT